MRWASIRVFALIAVVLGASASRAAQPDWTVVPLAINSPGLQAAIGDVDGDGRNELVVVSAAMSPALSIYDVSTGGTLTLKRSVTLPAPPSSAWQYSQPKILDVNGDGRNDIALYLRANNAPGKLILLQQTVAGYDQFVYPMPETDAAYNFAMADLDGDGLPEVLTANHGYAAPQTLFVTHNGTGPGRFTHTDAYPLPFAGIPGLAGFSFRGIVHVYAGDFNSDGFIDVAVSTHPFNSIASRLWFNDGTGHLATYTDLPGSSSMDLAFGDLNGDGRIDVIANDDRGNQLRIFTRSAGGYASPIALTTGGDPRTPVIADVNGDGAPDLITANTVSHDISFFYGDPFTRTIDASTVPFTLADPQLAATDFFSGGVAETLAVGDLDNDGNVDLLLIVDRLFWIRNGHVPADTVAPVLSLPASIVAEAIGPAGATVTYAASATDNVDGNVPVTCSPASGSIFPLGQTLVTCSTSDAHHNTASGTFNVVVSDTTPPDIQSLVASPSVLWPPNKKLVPVSIKVESTDLVDAHPAAKITGIASNEGTSADWLITGPLTLQLRADRLGQGMGRTYTITVAVSDSSGNTRSGTVTVTVPHDQR